MTPEKKTNYKLIIVNLLLIGLPKLFDMLNAWLKKTKVKLDAEETEKLSK